MFRRWRRQKKVEKIEKTEQVDTVVRGVCFFIDGAKLIQRRFKAFKITTSSINVFLARDGRAAYVNR